MSYIISSFQANSFLTIVEPVKLLAFPAEKFKLAAIVLCGGSSSRMGFDKFRLPFDGRTFLECVIEEVAEAIEGPIVVAASQRTISEVTKLCDSIGNSRVRIVVDQRDDSGPMEGIRAGLADVESEATWAFVTSCDVPLFCPEVLAVLTAAVSRLNDPALEAVMPASPDRIYGMTAIYKTSVVAKVADMIRRRSLRVSDLATELNTEKISLAEIRSADPSLKSMRNLNSPDQYLALLRDHGFDCPPDLLSKLN